MANTILIVDDDLELSSILTRALQNQGFGVVSVDNGNDAIKTCREIDPQIVVIDFDLPDINGQTVCREIREFSETYIVMLTGRTGENDKVVSLTIGADDYITKPFSFNELVARLHTLMRRPRLRSVTPSRIIGEVAVDFNARIVTVNNKQIELTRTEFDLLDCLTQQPGTLVTRKDLLQQVWGTTWGEDDHLIDVHMHKLRKKLTEAGAPKSIITTVRGIGFRFATAAVN